MKSNVLQKLSTSLLRWFLPILLISVAITAVASVVTGAWGPSGRATFSINSPATYVTFNSITDNPHHGDERNFVQVKETSNTSAGGWSDSLDVEIGKEYWVRMYVHNNAADSLNLVAENTRVTAAVPSTVGKQATITGQISASNANPEKVWDEAVLKSDQDFKLAYIAGSGLYHNNIFKNGTPISDSIVTAQGAQIGYTAMDGRVPGCFQYDGTVTFRLVVQAPSKPQHSVDKQVRKAGDTEWKNSITVKAGDKLEYLIGYRNIGNTIQRDVHIYDHLPKGVSYVAGSTTLRNPNNPQGTKVADGVTTTGIKIGDYATGANAYVMFSVTVNSDLKDFHCGKNTIRNFGHATSDGQVMQDYADIVIHVECEPEECKPGIPEGDERCEEKPPVEEEDDDEPGVIPDELPTTGPAEIIAGILGVTLVSLGAAYWIRSRQDYKRALAGFTEDFMAEPAEHLLEAKTDSQNDDDTHAKNFHQ